MTEKRFTVFKSKLTGLFVVNDNIHEFQFEGVENASTIMKLVGLLNNYIEENEQLKQRNENQYEQLNQLWELIEAKDWETLIAMDNQMKEDEERLQREWKCYE